MPLVIANTTLLDAYDPSTTFGQGDVFAWGFFTVANNPAFVQLFEGRRGQGVFQPEVYLPPATYPIAGGARAISGLRARNAIAGSAVQFFGSLFYPDEPGIQAGTPFTGAVSPSGAIGGGVGPINHSIVPVTVVNSAVETDLYTFTLPANTLGTDGIVRLRIGGDFVANAAGGVLPRFYFGAGVAAGNLTIQFGAFTADRRNWFSDVYLCGRGGTGLQQVLGQDNYMGSLNLGNEAGSTFNSAIAVDSTVDQLIRFSVDYTAASPNLETTMRYAILEKIA